MNSRMQKTLFWNISYRWIVLIGIIINVQLLVTATTTTQTSDDTSSSSTNTAIRRKIQSSIEEVQEGEVTSPFQEDGDSNPPEFTPAAYLKCYSLLDEVSAAASTLTQEQYLEFLELLTNGDVSVSRFQDLSAVFVMIYYTAACIEQGDCGPDITPEIDVGDTESPTDVIQLFCKHVLKNTFSTADANFEYTIRYNPDRIEEDALAICLSKATVNVLLDQMANCPLLDGTDINEDTTSTRKLLYSPSVQHAVLNSPAWDTYNKEKKKDDNKRDLQIIGEASNEDDAECRYQISATVDRITELPCEEATDLGDEESERCGLVRSTTTVTAAQIIEPFEALLRIQTISILRRTINGGEFTDYFPNEDCFLS